MKKIYFFLFQTCIFSFLIISNVFLNDYISSPFTKTDLITTLVVALIVIPFISQIEHIYKPFRTIKTKSKVILSIIAFVTAFILGAGLENIWFIMTGELLFG